MRVFWSLCAGLSLFGGTVKGDQVRAALSPVLPQVEFEETPILSAVEFLKGRSREHDPKKVGVNIVIDPSVDPATTVNLRLSEVSIGVILICLAEQADLDYRVDRFAFRILPFGEGELAEKELQQTDHASSSPQAKLARELTFAQIGFADAPVVDVLEFLSQSSREKGGQGLNLVMDHRIDQNLPVTFDLKDAAASTVLWAISKQTALEIRIEPYAILIEPPGSEFYREQRIERAREEARKGVKSRPRGRGYTLGTPPDDPRSPAHPDYVGSAHPDKSKRTNALNNVYKWVGGKWTFVRYGDGQAKESGLTTGSLGETRD
ncbi:MAG: hypothetical protein AAGF67_03280 [Verrucomicrobiota bacterium]